VKGRRGALRTCGIAVVVGIALVGIAHAATPRTLYQALLTTSLSPSKPVAQTFFADTVEAAEPSKNSKRHHAVGEVTITLNNGDALVRYVVFPRVADALAAWRTAAKLPGQRDSLPLSGFPKPSAIINGSFADQGHLYGYTNAAFVSLGVLVEGETISTTSKVSGDVSGAIRLLRWARAHLAAIRAKA
jgi:hypothetical protein